MPLFSNYIHAETELFTLNRFVEKCNFSPQPSTNERIIVYCRTQNKIIALEADPPIDKIDGHARDNNLFYFCLFVCLFVQTLPTPT